MPARRTSAPPRTTATQWRPNGHKPARAVETRTGLPGPAGYAWRAGYRNPAAERAVADSIAEHGDALTARPVRRVLGGPPILGRASSTRSRAHSRAATGARGQL